MYTVTHTTYTTPRGVPIELAWRVGTNDHNTLYSCLDGDEYGLAALHLTGTAVDIGAYLGGVTIALAVDNPELRVIAIEPLPDNATLMRENIDRAGVADRVTVLEAAAGSKGQKTESTAWNWSDPGGKLEETMHHHRYVGGSTLALDNEGMAHDTVTTQAYSISSLLKLAKVERFSFLKIDCEGCEAKVLTDPAVSKVDRMAGEWHPWYMTEEGLHDLLDATHEVRTWGTGPGGFEAVRK